MRYAAALNGSSYLLLLAGFAAVVAAGGLAPAPVLLFLLALVASWWRRPLEISSFRQFLAVLGFMAIYGLDLLGSGDLVGATIRLLLVLACFKLLTLGGGRDYLLVYLISFALMLIASVYTLSIVYLVALIIYLFLSVLTLILFESYKGYTQFPRARFSFGGYLAMATGITGLTLLLAVPIFLAVPRLTVGFLRNQQRLLAGFSDTVELGELGALLRNSEIVMRVTVDKSLDQLTPELKWRGIALDHYDGRRWSTRIRRRRALAYNTDGTYLLRNRSGPELLLQEFFVEPLTHVVFGAPEMVQVTLPEGRNQVEIDAAGNVSAQWVRQSPTRYFVYSEVAPRAHRLTAVSVDEIPLRIRSVNLQLPQLDPRIVELAQRVTLDARSDVDRALMLEEFLRSDFDYTLTNPSGGAEDPLADFLLSTRAGHCEYSATAQAVMMRILGIPARVVNGFRAGTYNEWQDHFTVRQSDAHSWVEGYFPGAGWIEFDPTPPDRIEKATGFFAMLSQMMDTLDVFWTEVITFNRNKQAGFFTSLAASAEEQWQKLTEVGAWRAGILKSVSAVTGWVRARPKLIPPLLVGLAGLLVLAPIRHRLQLGWQRWRWRGEAARLAPAYYRALLRLLRRRGLSPENGETPAEFSRRCSLKLRSEVPVRVTQMYYRARWGGQSLAEMELAALAADLKTLEKGWRRNREDRR